MKPLFKVVFATCVSILMCGLLCCTASAYSSDDLKTNYNDRNSNNNEYGADIVYKILPEKNNEVKATIIKCYSDRAVDIPETVKLHNSDTGESETFTITELAISKCETGADNDDVKNLNATLSVPSNLRTIHGNLFSWKKTKTKDISNHVFWNSDTSGIRIQVLMSQIHGTC